MNSCKQPTPEVEIHTRQRICHFGCYVAKAKAINWSKKFRPGYPGWEIFHPGCRDLGRKNRDLGNRASPAFHMNTSKFLRRKLKSRGEISETEPTGLRRIRVKYEVILKGNC